MIEFIKKYNVFKIVLSVLSVCLGIALICVPNATLFTICNLVGTFLMVFGCFSIANFLVSKRDSISFSFGLILVASGLLIIVFAKQLTSPQVFAILAGVYVIFNAVSKMQRALQGKLQGIKYWWVYLVFSITLIAFAVVMFVYPFAVQKIFLIFLGIVVLIDGLVDLISMIIFQSKLSKLEKEKDKDIIDI